MRLTHTGAVLTLVRSLARRVASKSLWPLLDGDVQAELEQRMARHQSRWRAEAWAVGQYVSITVGLFAERTSWHGHRGRFRFMTWLDGMLSDFRHALRAMRSRLGTTVTVVGTVAVAVGATTSVYSVVDAVLLRPLPYPEPDRLVRIWETQPDWRESSNERLRDRADRLMTNAPIYYDWLEADVGFTSLGAYRDANFVWQRQPGAQVLKGQQINSGAFETLGIEPILGRRFLSADDREGAELVVLLSESFWTEHYAANPNVLGETLMLNGGTHTVIGVMPHAFTTPAYAVGNDRNGPDGSPTLWTTFDEETRRGWSSVHVIARLEAGVAMDVAATRFASANDRIKIGHPEWQQERGVRVENLLASVVGDVRTTLWFLFAASGLVLVVAAVNIANILIAQAITRRREMAVRAAVGASAGRLVRAMFTESAVLATLGGLVGVALAYMGAPLLTQLVPPTVPRNELIQVNLAVLLCGIMITGLTAVVIGTFPAMFLTKIEPDQALRSAPRGATSDRTTSRIRAMLVVAEVSCVFVLLLGAGLLGRSYLRLSTVDTGFETDGLAAMWVVPDRGVYSTAADQRRFVRELRAELDRTTGVSGTAANNLPLSGMSSGANLMVEGGTFDRAPFIGLLATADDNYLDVVGIELMAGRWFEPRDRADGPLVAVVNETMARISWPDENVLGKRLRTFDDTTASLEVVGITRDVKHVGLGNDVQPTVYLPSSQSNRDTYEWILRIDGDMATGITAAREAVAAVSVSTPVTRTFVLNDVIAQSVAVPRFRAYLILALASFAALLGLLGVYGVVSFAVADQTKEIGLRIALGAQKQQVLSQTVWSGLRLTIAGIGVGLLFALFGAQFLDRFLFEVSPTDHLTYLAMIATLLGIGVTAAYVPARRAAAVDPVGAIKGD